MSASKHTTDHDTIRKWAEQRGGRPSRVKNTGHDRSDSGGVLRFDFGEDDDVLEDMSWEDFFRVFDERKLALIYQEKTASGELSRFGKFVSRDASD